MSRTSTASDQPLGTVLQQAGLVTASQVQVALEEQKHSHRRIGEILANHGYLKQKSADFFAEQWPQIQHQTWQPQLGQYLKQAALLEGAQIRAIVQEQQQTQLKFGTLAILKGWVQRRTVNFFLEHLDQHSMHPVHQRAIANDISSGSEKLRKQLLQNITVNPFSLLLAYQRILLGGTVEADGSLEQAELIDIGLVVVAQNRLQVARGLDPLLLNPQWVTQELDQLRPYNQIRLKLFKLGKNSEHPYQVLAAIQSWTGNQPDLIRAVCRAVRETGVFIAAGEEAAQIDTLVRHHIIYNWESGAAAQHLLGLRDRWLAYQGGRPQELLKLYGRVLEESEVLAEGTLEEQVLLILGLLTKAGGSLSVANPIYRCIFNHPWITQEIIHADTVQGREKASFSSTAAQPEQTLMAIPDVGENLSAEEIAFFLSPTALGNTGCQSTDDVGLFTLPAPDATEDLSTEEIASFASAPELQEADFLAVEVDRFTLLEPDVSEELSVEEAASFASVRELQAAADLPAVASQIKHASVTMPDPQPADEVTPSPPPSTKPRRAAFWLILCTVVTGTAIAISALLWRRPTQVSPVASFPASEEAPVAPAPRQITPPSQDYEASIQEKAPSQTTSPSVQTMAPSVSNSNLVVSTLDPTVKIPIFATGISKQQLLDNLGPPTREQEGYYPGSQALFYKGIVPNRVDLGYLVNKATGELLQTEIAFDQSVQLETIQRALHRLTQGNLPDSVQAHLLQIYRRQADQHSFTIENWEGEIHRDPEGKIYMGIWDADFH